MGRERRRKPSGARKKPREEEEEEEKKKEERKDVTPGPEEDSQLAHGQIAALGQLLDRELRLLVVGQLKGIGQQEGKGSGITGFEDAQGTP